MSSDNAEAVKTTSLGIAGIWWAIALASVIHGLLMLGWFEMGRWYKQKIVYNKDN